MQLSKCAICGGKKSTFIKVLEASGLNEIIKTFLLA